MSTLLKRLERLEEQVGIKTQFKEREEPWIIFELKGKGNSSSVDLKIKKILGSKLHYSYDGDRCVNVKDFPSVTRVAEDNGFEISVLERCSNLKLATHGTSDGRAFYFWIADSEDRKDVLRVFRNKWGIDGTTLNPRRAYVSSSFRYANKIKNYAEQKGYNIIIYKVNNYRDFEREIPYF